MARSASILLLLLLAACASAPETPVEEESAVEVAQRTTRATGDSDNPCPAMMIQVCESTTGITRECQCIDEAAIFRIQTLDR